MEDAPVYQCSAISSICNIATTTALMADLQHSRGSNHGRGSKQGGGQQVQMGARHAMASKGQPSPHHPSRGSMEPHNRASS
mmetsp:Transcript_4234/g.11426  ORF Transcript_4234/g.11426 Transcript_4234/m.11426 type:complete len:81 (+) Transcript_4234:184-426(+)